MTDRLQIALDKARAEREAQGISSRPRTARPQPQADVAAAWAALAPLEVDRKLMARNRIVGLQSGPEKAPFDMLRTRVIQQAKSKGWRRIAIVSPHSGCGKSTVAANLGFCFGRQHDLRTLVLDLDMRRMGLAKILGQKGRTSLGDVIERRESFANHALRFGDNMAFGLSTGDISNPSEILQSKRTVEFLHEIDETYKPDFVLCELPPLMGIDDSHGFLKNVDCALLLVEAEHTPMAQIDAAERQVAELTNVLGIVLNKCRFDSGNAGYDYA